jgi:hypothetical protein
LSYIDFVFEFACGGSRLSEDSGAVTIFIRVDNFQGFIKGFSLDYYENRPENFFTAGSIGIRDEERIGNHVLVTFHGSHGLDNCWSYKVPKWVSLDVHISSV